MSRTKIQTVAPGTPAHQAGVRAGETLTAPAQRLLQNP